jgi:hypothetical protein
LAEGGGFEISLADTRNGAGHDVAVPARGAGWKQRRKQRPWIVVDTSADAPDCIRERFDDALAGEDAVSAQFSDRIAGYAKATFERFRKTRHTAQYFDP